MKCIHFSCNKYCYTQTNLDSWVNIAEENSICHTVITLLITLHENVYEQIKDFEEPNIHKRITWIVIVKKNSYIDDDKTQIKFSLMCCKNLEFLIQITFEKIWFTKPRLMVKLRVV